MWRWIAITNCIPICVDTYTFDVTIGHILKRVVMADQPHTCLWKGALKDTCTPLCLAHSLVPGQSLVSSLIQSMQNTDRQHADVGSFYRSLGLSSYLLVLPFFMFINQITQIFFLEFRNHLDRNQLDNVESHQGWNRQSTKPSLSVGLPECMSQETFIFFSSQTWVTITGPRKHWAPFFSPL